MPFVSQAQNNACFAKKDPNWNCREFAAKTDYSKLPKRKKSAAFLLGLSFGKQANPNLAAVLSNPEMQEKLQASPSQLQQLAGLAGGAVGTAALGATTGAAIGGVSGALQGHARGNVGEGLGRGILRGGATGLGAGAGAVLGGAGLGALTGQPVIGAVGGAIGGGLLGHQIAGKMLGEPVGRPANEEQEKQATAASLVSRPNPIPAGQSPFARTDAGAMPKGMRMANPYSPGPVETKQLPGGFMTSPQTVKSQIPHQGGVAPPSHLPMPKPAQGMSPAGSSLASMGKNKSAAFLLGCVR